MRFLPLMVGFFLLVLVVGDLRHPQVTQRSCSVIALGTGVASLLKNHSPLYHTGRGAQHNIGLSCEAPHVNKETSKKSIWSSPALLWVNDEAPFAFGRITLGDRAILRDIHYQFLPVQHRLTVNSQ
ncbi:MAG: hypothetical protein VKK59_00180 [Vampirovibrionales bacterium]|nr:hypothetical protein [Vampirovibrionales bacterium]